MAALACGALALGYAALGLAGCGGSGNSALVVTAASSLTRPLSSCSPHFGDVRLSFAGSDQLAAQIRRGAKPDVYVAANTRLPDALRDEGLVEQPLVFATNVLVLAVPSASSKVRALSDLAKPGTTIAVGSPSSPIGSYTRDALDRLPRRERAAILHNVRSQEPDVSGVVGKLSEHAVDAGFVYASDVQAAGGRLRAIELPPRLQPLVAYAAAVVTGTGHPGAAQRYVGSLVSGECARELRQDGFGPAPSGS
jgi:molybdate transport system substrate-binding protein